MHHYISFRVINQQAVLRKILFVVKYVYQATNSVELLDNVFVILHAYWYKCLIHRKLKTIYNKLSQSRYLPTSNDDYKLSQNLKFCLEYHLNIVLGFDGIYFVALLMKGICVSVSSWEFQLFVFRTCFLSNRNEWLFIIFLHGDPFKRKGAQHSKVVFVKTLISHSNSLSIEIMPKILRCHLTYHQFPPT